MYIINGFYKGKNCNILGHFTFSQTFNAFEKKMKAKTQCVQKLSHLKIITSLSVVWGYLWCPGWVLAGSEARWDWGRRIASDINLTTSQSAPPHHLAQHNIGADITLFSVLSVACYDHKVFKHVSQERLAKAKEILKCA